MFGHSLIVREVSRNGNVDPEVSVTDVGATGGSVAAATSTPATPSPLQHGVDWM
jgi:hypothetical protein